MRVVLLAMFASGCYGPTPPAGAACADNGACPSSLTCINGYCVASADGGGTDATGDGTVTCDGFVSHHFDPCALPAAGTLQLTSQYAPWTLDTDGGTTIKGRMNHTIPITTTVIDQGGNPALVVSTDNFAIDANVSLRVIGARPLIIASRTTISIAGTISISGIGTSTAGGSNPSLCTSATSGDDGAGGAGGGGGGGFHAAGGAGGRGDSDMTGGAIKNGGAASPAVGVPTIVRGGCSGAHGGNAGGGNAAAGAGGGALQLTAKTSITIGGTVNAGGGGGLGGVADGGGAGGGAGGYIGLEAPLVTITGGVAANGGGGGEGATGVGGGDAQVATTSAAGGNTTTCGTAGGNGGALVTEKGGDVVDIDTCGGGGGGGGIGYILVWGQQLSTSGTLSPVPISNPF